MNISITVGILILTVFLSLSAPACAGTDKPYLVYGYVDLPDGKPADGATVTICTDEDPSKGITAEVGSSYGATGWWKGDLYNMPGSLAHGDTLRVTVPGRSTTFVVDTSGAGMKDPRVSDLTIDNSGSGSGNSGTYPPTPTPTATPAPTAALETVATTEAPTEEPPKDSTAAQTETEITEFMTKSTPGFGAVLTVFAIAGLLVATYLVMRRRE